MKHLAKLLGLVFLFTSCTMFNGLFDDPDRLWIEVASGERQCIPPNYSSLDDAIEQLESNGIEVFDKDELNMVVCMACTCPTGIIYRAYINESDLEDAKDLGWISIHDSQN